MNKIFAILLAAVVTSASAHDNWTTGSGQVLKNSTGLCWRNSAWTPATAAPECDGAVSASPKGKAETPKPQVTKLTFASDAFFDFDKSTIKPAGKQSLNALIAKLQGVTLEVVIVVGHTDSVGSDAYNLKLGERRANAVKAYLVSQGIAPARIYTESKGERMPVADNKTSAGRAKNRRVEVEVIGTSK